MSDTSSFREMAERITGDDFASRLARASALAAAAKFDLAEEEDRDVD